MGDNPEEPISEDERAEASENSDHSSDGAESIPEEPAEDVQAEEPESPAPKRRGRPPGSKNKAKAAPKAQPKPPASKAKASKAPKRAAAAREMPEIDMRSLTRMLAQHLADEKTFSRERKQAVWGTFF